MKPEGKEPPWAKHTHHVWQERARNAKNPTWLRIVALCYGYHNDEGRVYCKPGQISKLLEVSPQVVSNAIKTARDDDWISGESNSRCLVAPPYAIMSGRGPGKLPD